MNEASLLKQVNEKQLMEYTTNIAKEVRISGSAEELRAFQYTQRQLDSIGFETKLYKRKGYISYPISATLEIAGKNYSAITHSMAPSTDESGVNAKLVYVGDGNEKDYQEDITGKTVLIGGLAIPGAVAIAERNGAVAAIFINAEYTHEMIVSTVWGNPTDEPNGDYPNLPIVSINYQDGQDIKATLSNQTLSSHIVTSVCTEWRDIPTLVADYKGEKDPDDYVLFSGHIDSWHYGAMDNGSANATMLEVARVIAKNKVPLYRTLRLAFWSGHSHGRYAGSTLYADEHWEDLYDHCVLHLNIDSVGGKAATVLTEGNAMAETKAVARKAVHSITGKEFVGTRYGKAGDQSFWGPGVPSLLMGLSEQEVSDTPAMAAFAKLFGGGKGGGFGWWWHTTEDTIDKLDPANLKRDCQVYLSIVLDICTKKKLPVDQLAAAKEIKTQIVQYAEVVPHLEVFQTIISRLDDLMEKVIEVEEKAKLDALQTTDMIGRYNKWNKALSKGLIRLNYVKNDPFNHDSTKPKQPVPLLSDALQLKQGINNHKRLKIETKLLRNANKVNFLIRELNGITANYLKGLERN